MEPYLKALVDCGDCSIRELIVTETTRGALDRTQGMTGCLWESNMEFEIENGCLKKYHPLPGKTKVVIPQDVTVIGHHAFSDCQTLTELEIPWNVEHIAKAAFCRCTALKAVLVARGTIGDHAFDGCTGLMEAVIGPDVTSIGVHAFSGCGHLRRVSILGNIVKIGSAAFKGCHALADEYGLCVVRDVLYDYIPQGKGGELLIPEGIKAISALAFHGCGTLKSIVIAQSVSRIGASAFKGCGNLETVTLPQRLASMGECAFLECTSLTNLVIPEGVSEIPGRNRLNPDGEEFWPIPGVFENCVHLKSVLLPQGLTRIGVRAFNGCTSLSDISIPDSVTVIDNLAFGGCSNLRAVRLSPHVDVIGWCAFERCSPCGIQHVRIPAMPDGLEKENFFNRIRRHVSSDADIMEESGA